MKMNVYVYENLIFNKSPVCYHSARQFFFSKIKYNSKEEKKED